MFQKIGTFVRSYRLPMVCATALYVGATTPAYADAEAAKEFAKQPGVIFARELLDVPGKNLVVVRLEIPPKPAQPPASPDQSIGHRHPGSVYVYVTKGAVRFGIEGQPVQMVHEGESAFEPMGAVHTILENTSTKKPATVIAFLIVPDGAPILTPVEVLKK